MTNKKCLSARFPLMKVSFTSWLTLLITLIANDGLAEDKSIIDTLSHELCHVSVVEVLRIAISHIILPLSFLFILCLISRLKWCKDKMEIITSRIDVLIITIGFEDIFRRESRKKLNEHYIKNALMTARSHKYGEKLNAIKQLSQYVEDSALSGLIRLLAIEKDVAFQYLIINALSNIVKKRKKNNH